jgi:hypothetical protein
MSNCSWNCGKGFGSHINPDSVARGGINPKRLALQPENPLVLCKREILGLIAKEHYDAARQLLIDCPANPEQKEVFYKKHLSL